MMSGENRWRFLFFSSLAFFAAEIINEQISVLNARLQGTAEACHNGEDENCLRFTASEFNGLYVAHCWAGGLGALFTGFFVGRFGIWTASLVSAAALFVGM